MVKRDINNYIPLNCRGPSKLEKIHRSKVNQILLVQEEHSISFYTKLSMFFFFINNYKKKKTFKTTSGLFESCSCSVLFSHGLCFMSQRQRTGPSRVGHVPSGCAYLQFP